MINNEIKFILRLIDIIFSIILKYLTLSYVSTIP